MTSSTPYVTNQSVTGRGARVIDRAILFKQIIIVFEIGAGYHAWTVQLLVIPTIVSDQLQ